MNGKSYNHFDYDEDEIKYDADNKSAVDLFEIDGVMMMTKAMMMIVIVGRRLIVCMCVGVRHLLKYYGTKVLLHPPKKGAKYATG